METCHSKFSVLSSYNVNSWYFLYIVEVAKELWDKIIIIIIIIITTTTNRNLSYVKLRRLKS